MHFSMDVTINSFPPSNWASVFHCGTSDGDRYPAIYIHPSSGVFYVGVNGGSSVGDM